jgi:hypothetical protein
MTRHRQFYGKTWYYAAQAIVFGAFGLIMLIMGTLGLLGFMKAPDGRTDMSSGAVMLLVSVALFAIAALAIYNIAARQQPILRLCQEGLEITIIGASSLARFPIQSPWLQMTWLIISLQGFRTQYIWAPWDSVKRATVSGLPMAQTLTIIAQFYSSRKFAKRKLPPVAGQWEFRDAEFEETLDLISDIITAYVDGVEPRNQLPSWNPAKP